MDCLVLGGSRFIGLHLVQALAGSGHRVAVLNRGITPVTYPAGVEHLRADRFDTAAMQTALRGRSFDGVFDVSGWGPTEVGIAVDALAGRMRHFLFTSSIAVYAPTEVFPVTEEFPLMRDAGGGKYSLGKVACEDLLVEAAHRHGFQMTMVRPPSVYGPHNYLETREFAYFARLEQSRKILLPAHGLSIVHLVHAEDVARAFILCLANPAAYGQAFNIAGNELVSLRGWVQIMADVVGVEVDIVYVPTELEAYVEYGPGPPLPPESFPINWHFNAALSNEKAQRLIGYVPRYSMADGLSQTYEWYRRQPPGRWQRDFSRDDECLRKLNLA